MFPVIKLIYRIQFQGIEITNTLYHNRALVYKEKLPQYMLRQHNFIEFYQ